MVSTGIKDVEMKDSKVKKEDKNDVEAEQVVEEKKDPDVLTLEDLKQQVHLIEKSVQVKDPRFVARVLRALTTTRKKLNKDVLIALINGYFTSPSNDKSQLLEYLDQSMETDAKPLPFQPRSAKASAQPLLPEVATYISLLLLIYLIDNKLNDKAVTWSTTVTDKLTSLNRRTLDGLQAKCYFYYARAHELVGQLDSIRRYILKSTLIMIMIQMITLTRLIPIMCHNVKHLSYAIKML